MSLLMVEVITEKLESLQLPLQGSSNGYEIHDIQGLDPVKAEIVASSFGTVDGTQYQTSRRGNRNVVIKLGYTPDFITNDVSSLRNALYSKLMPKSSIRLLFHMSDGTIPEISGRVETFESPLFTKDPEATLSVICFQSDFINPEEVIFEGWTAVDLPENRLEFTYSGNINTGAKLIINVDRTLTDLAWRHYGPDNIVSSIDLTSSVDPLIAGDIVEISTVQGKKGAWRTRGTNKESILYNISPESIYFQITPGQNFMQVIAEGTGIPVVFSYFNRYGGL